VVDGEGAISCMRDSTPPVTTQTLPESTPASTPEHASSRVIGVLSSLLVNVGLGCSCCAQLP
jgi:hypothetical protein